MNRKQQIVESSILWHHILFADTNVHEKLCCDWLSMFLRSKYACFHFDNGISKEPKRFQDSSCGNIGCDLYHQDSGVAREIQVEARALGRRPWERISTLFAVI